MATRVVTVAVCVALAGLFLQARHGGARPVGEIRLAELPMQLDAWRGRPLPELDASTLDVLQPDDYLFRAYVGQASAVGLFVAYFASQERGASIHSPANCLPGAGWEALAMDRTAIDVPNRAPVVANVNLVQKGHDKQLVLYWYQSRGRTVASEYAAKAYLLLDALRWNRSDQALVRVTTPIFNGEAAARQRAFHFVRALAPALDRQLPGL